MHLLFPSNGTALKVSAAIHGVDVGVRIGRSYFKVVVDAPRLDVATFFEAVGLLLAQSDARVCVGVAGGLAVSELNVFLLELFLDKLGSIDAELRERNLLGLEDKGRHLPLAFLIVPRRLLLYFVEVVLAEQAADDSV